jgi:hypothetical protein
VRIETPRDRNATFEPRLVRKRQRRFEGFDDKILALYSRGLSTRDIEAHLADVYGVRVGRDLISRVTDAVMEDVREWQQRPLDDVYPVIFLDALVLKIREGGMVQRRACYLALGVTVEGERDVLGIWFQETEGAKFWMQVLSELRQRGVQDILVCCVDGLKGFPEAIEAIYPQTVVQTCIVHLIRLSLKYVPRREREQVARDLKPIYTAIDADAAQAALEAFDDKWGSRFPVITQAWLNAWEYMTPFLVFPAELRRVVYTTDEKVKSPAAAPVVESARARVTPDRRAGYGDGSPAAQDCRLTASEPLPGGGTRALRPRALAPLLGQLGVRPLGLLAERALARFAALLGCRRGSSRAGRGGRGRRPRARARAASARRARDGRRRSPRRERGDASTGRPACARSRQRRLARRGGRARAGRRHATGRASWRTPRRPRPASRGPAPAPAWRSARAGPAGCRTDAPSGRARGS